MELTKEGAHSLPMKMPNARVVFNRSHSCLRLLCTFHWPSRRGGEGRGGGQRAIKIKKFPLLDGDHIDEHQTTVNHLKLEEKEVAFIYFRYPKSTSKLKGKTEV